MPGRAAPRLRRGSLSARPMLAPAGRWGSGPRHPKPACSGMWAPIAPLTMSTGHALPETAWNWGTRRLPDEPEVLDLGQDNGTSAPWADVDQQAPRDDLNLHPEQYKIGCAAATKITIEGGGQSPQRMGSTSVDQDWVAVRRIAGRRPPYIAWRRLRQKLLYIPTPSCAATTSPPGAEFRRALKPGKGEGGRRPAAPSLQARRDWS